MGRFISCALVAGVVVLALGVARAQDTIEPDDPIQGTVNSDKVNLRLGTGTQYGAIDMMLRGDKVTILRKLSVQGAEGVQDWFAVKPPKGNYYISNDLLDFDRNDKGALVDGAAVNVRLGPGVDFDRVGQLDKGTRLVVVKKGEKWSQVSLPENTTCYIAARFVDPAKPDAFQVARTDPDQPDEQEDPDEPDQPDKPEKPDGAGTDTPKEVTVPEGRKLAGDTFNEKLADYDTTLKAELAKPLVERDLESLSQSLEYPDAAYDLNFNQKVQLQARAEALKGYVKDYLAKKTIYEDYLATQEKILEEAADKKAAIETGRNKDKQTWDVTGIVKPWGLSKIMPGVTHKLVSDDGEETTLMLLSGDGVDLVKYVDQRVGMNYRKTGNVAYDKPIVEVTGVKVLPIPAPE